MEVEELTENAIKEMLNNNTTQRYIIQIYQIERKTGTSAKLKISDGFVEFRGISGTISQQIMDFDVLEIMEFGSMLSRKGNPPSIVAINLLKMHKVCSCDGKIGMPILYDEYKNNGGINPNGSRAIHVVPNEQTSSFINQNREFSNNSMRADTTRQSDQSKQNSYQNGPQRNIQQNMNAPQQGAGNSRTNPQPNPRQNPQQNPQQNQQQKQPPKPRQNPQQNPQQNRQHSNQRQSAEQENAQKLKNLFIGADNKIIIRVLNVFPSKSLTANGRQFNVMNIEVGDNTDTIMLAAFGQEAEKYETSFTFDRIYMISSIKVSEKEKNGKKIKMYALTNSSIVNPMSNNVKIRSFSDFAISVDQLLHKNIGENFKVVCLIKDKNQPDTFPNKNGGITTRKRIMICDPEQRKEVEITLWNQKAQMQWGPGPYFLRDVVVSQYKQKKQFELCRFDFYFVELPSHRYSQYLEDFESMDFQNPFSFESKKEQVPNLTELLQKSKQLQKEGILWTETIFNIKSVRSTSQKNQGIIYFSCPAQKCHKKVEERLQAKCSICSNQYQECNYKYGFSMEINDSYDSIWVTCFNNAAEKIVKDPQTGKCIVAKDLFRMEQEQQLRVIEHMKTMRLKFLVKTYYDEFNNILTLKHAIIKVLEVDSSQEIRKGIEEIKSDTGSPFKVHY